MLSPAPSVRSEHLVAEMDFFFVDQPFADKRISFSQKNNMQIDSVNVCEGIEDGYAIWRDDFGQDRQFSTHSTHSR